MSRAKKGSPRAHARHTKILKMAKGYRGRSGNCFRPALQRVEKGLQYAYRDRRNKKRDFRGLWIQRINAGARLHGLTYSTFINGLNKAGIEIDRKVLSDLAIHDEAAFKALIDQAQAALAKAQKAA
jgi:large subunit ribosomal protein L20